MIYSKHFITKPLFFSTEKRILVIMYSGIQFQNIYYQFPSTETIKYTQIISFLPVLDKENDLQLTFTKKQTNKKVQQIQYLIKTDEKNLLLSEYYRGIDQYYFLSELKMPYCQFSNMSSIKA